MDLKLHPIQSKILMALLFTPESRFTDLNTEGVTSDHFNFHIQRLVDAKLIVKNNNDLYELTPKGKEFANRFDTDAGEVEKQPKVSVVVIGQKKEGEKNFYLMQRRLKHPFYGYLGAVSGKVRFGETFAEAAARELWEEAGVTGDLTWKGIEHKMDYDDKNKVLEDKIFLIFQAINFKGQLIEKFKGGENIWIREDQVQNQEKLFEDVLQIFEILNASAFGFFEQKYIYSPQNF